jgi:hypothetical protein
VPSTEAGISIDHHGARDIRWEMEQLVKRSVIGTCVLAPLLALGLSCAGPAGADPSPTLGTPHPLQWAEGFGTVQPTYFSLASTASSTVTQITWDSWGGPQAIGHGLNADGVDSPPLHVEVVAFDLGPCAGPPVYRKVARVTPGGQFDPNEATDICGYSGD